MRLSCLRLVGIGLGWLAVGGVFVPGLVGADWPQWRGERRDGVWRETGIVERLPAGEIKPKWKAPIRSGYSGPTVAEGRVYVMDRVTEPEQIERVHCFDAESGKPIWTQKYPAKYRDVGYTAGPRASVLIEEGRAYSLGTMGNLFCLDAKDGKVLWEKELGKEYKIRMPMWGLACSPIIEGEVLIVVAAAEKACVVGLDKRTGGEKWRALDDMGQYSTPIVIEQGGRKVVVVWTGENVAGLDPQTGEVYWKQPMKVVQMPIGIATPIVGRHAKLGEVLYVSSFYDGSMLLRLTKDADGKPATEQVWRRRGRDEQHTDSLHAMIGTPVFDGDAIYGFDSYGELRCIDVETGDRVWESLEAVPKARWSMGHLVRQGERYVLFNERGALIFCKLDRQGYHEQSRAQLIAPTTGQLSMRGGVCWSHPAFAGKCVFARNDEELVCADLSGKE